MRVQNLISAILENQSNCHVLVQQFLEEGATKPITIARLNYRANQAQRLSNHLKTGLSAGWSDPTKKRIEHRSNQIEKLSKRLGKRASEMESR